MKTVKVPNSRRITLPKAVFKPTDRVALLAEGDMLIIKKLEPPKLSAIATRVKARPLPLRTIVKEVHAYRRAKRAR